MKAIVLVSNGGKAYSKQVIEVLPDASLATIGQVATVTAVGTVAFVDPFLKSGGTINGTLNVSSGQYQINGLTAIYDNGGIWGNLRVVGNMSGPNNDGIYLGYNQSNAPVRLYDGSVSNYLNLAGATFSSVGINKWLFGSQSDDGTFAQFNGDVKAKSNLSVNNNVSIGRDLYIAGGNASNAGFITANSSGGGLYFSALGINQNLRFVPTGIGYNHFVNNSYFAGNIGVGLTNPTEAITIGTGGKLRFNRSDNLAFHTLFYDGSDDLKFYNGNGGAFIFGSNSVSELAKISSSGVFSTTGIMKFLFGNQSDDGTFAQFNGAVKIKNDLTVTGTNGTFSTNSVQSNLYFLNLIRSSVALTTVGYAGFGLSNPLAPVHAFGGTAMTAGWSKTSILQAQYPVQVFNSNSTKWAGIGYDSGYAMRFWVNATSDDVAGTGVPALSILNNGNINTSGGISSYFFKLPNASSPNIYDNSSDNTYINARVIYNGSGTIPDGIYLGYANTNGSANRIYDGGGSNYLRIGSATFSSVGISKWLFGDQSDNGTFAQFSGAIHAKAGLGVDGYFSFGNAGTRTESLDDAGTMGGRSGFFESSNPSNFPAGASSWWHLISARHSNTGNNYAMQIAGSFFDQRIYFRKTGNTATQAWREFVTSDMAGNVSIAGVINTAKGFNLNGNGGFYNGASKFGMDFYSGNTRFYSSGATTTTKGGFEFHNLNSDGTGDNMVLLIGSDGRIGVNTWNPVAALDVNGHFNTSGLLMINGGAFAQWDGAYQRIYKRNGVAAFSIANTETYYDADTAHNFRGSGGTYALRIDTANSILTTYTTRNLFGSQSDDGTANQFAGAIKAKSDLTVAGISYLSATRFNSYVVMNNNAFTYWKDSGGNDRRILGVSAVNNVYVGDVDATLEGSVYYMSKYDHIFYGFGSEKMRLAQNGTLTIQGGIVSPIRTISGGTATYTINSTDNVVIINTSPGSSFTIDAPIAGNKGRELILVNKSIASQTLSQNYINLSGSSTNQIPNNGRTHLKYNGTEIHQI